MCGHFTQNYTWRELVELYRLTQPALNLRPHYNIAPTTAIDVVRWADSGPRACPDALGPHSVLVEKDGEGGSFDVLRAGLDGRAKADVLLGLQTHTLHRASIRLLRMAAGRWRQAALFHRRSGWRRAVNRGPMG